MSPSTLLHLLVFLSGFAVLIYEVCWQRYLAVLLGAQAEATAIELAVLFGALGAGYYCLGRWAKGTARNLYRVYAWIEVGIGLWAFLIPLFFRGARWWVPELMRIFGVDTLLTDILASAALIGVPSFLMGGTLPLLTQAMSRSMETATATHSKIYGWNTVGAFFGCFLGHSRLVFLFISWTVSRVPLLILRLQ